MGSVCLALSACGGTEVKPSDTAEVEKMPMAEKQVDAVVEKSVEAVEKQVESTSMAMPEEVAEPVKQMASPPAVTKEATTAAPPTLNARNPTSDRAPSEKELKQKISYAGMMFMSKSSKRVAASDNEQAKATLNDSKSKMEQAKQSLASGDLKGAQSLIDESMRMFNAASIMVPSEAVIAEQRKRYEEALNELEASRVTHKENFDRMVKKNGAASGVEYDVEQVDILVHEAGKLANDKDFESASATVDSANRMVNAAISEMLHDQTITYELNIDTPEGEWAYELNRYLGYEELIPVAIENKKPNKGQMFLINRNVDKGKEMAESARATANAGDYPKAIAMILDATKEVRKALRLMGVKQ